MLRCATLRSFSDDERRFRDGLYEQCNGVTVIYSSFVYWCLDEGSGASSVLALCTDVLLGGTVLHQLRVCVMARLFV